MGDSLAGIVLAAGEGRRLRPLTLLRPKPLCPVADRSLLEYSLGAVAGVVALGPESVAVNLHHGARAIEAALEARPGPPVYRSHEDVAPLGTAGAVGALRGWLGGRDVLILNGDTVHDADLSSFVAGWDRERVRILSSSPGPFGPRSTVVASLLPASMAAALTPEPSGLWETVWRVEVAAGRVDTVFHPGWFADCGTPRSYLVANLHASGGAPVIGAGAEVSGSLDRSVVWPGVRVGAAEHLVGVIRATDRVSLWVRPVPAVWG